MAEVQGFQLPPGVAAIGWQAFPTPDGGLHLVDEGGARPGLKLGGADGWRPGQPIPDWIYDHYANLPQWSKDRLGIEAPPPRPGVAPVLPLLPSLPSNAWQTAPNLTPTVPVEPEAAPSPPASSNQGHYPETAGLIKTMPPVVPATPAVPAVPAVPALTSKSTTEQSMFDPNAPFSKIPMGKPFTLGGPLAETPFGQIAGQVLGRGYLPAFNFLQLMAQAEHQRLVDEQQKLIDAAAIEVQRGNLQLAADKARNAQEIAGRVQALAEQMQRGQQEIERLNAGTQRDVAGRQMTLQEKVTPYEATTRRMVGLAPIATSPLVNWYTARGEAPPQIIGDLLSNLALAPGQAPPAPTMGTSAGKPREQFNPRTGQMEPAYYAMQTRQTGTSSTGAAPFTRALASGETLPAFTGSVGPYAPPLPGGAQWSSMTPGERAGTQDIFESYGIPQADFSEMLRRSLPPGGSPETMANAARFVSATR